MDCYLCCGGGEEENTVRKLGRGRRSLGRDCDGEERHAREGAAIAWDDTVLCF